MRDESGRGDAATVRRGDTGHPSITHHPSPITWISRYGVLLILLGLCIYFGAVSRDHIFLTKRNLLNIGQQISVNGVLAVGLTLVILSGGIDLSVGSVLAAGAVAAAAAATHAPGAALLAGILAGVAAGLAAGAINAAVITRLRAAPFIATLAMLAIARAAALKVTQARPITGLPDAFTRLGGGAAGEPLGIPLPVWITGALFLAAHLLLSRTELGRRIYAVGGSEEAARLSGVRVDRVKAAVYVTCGALAGLAGAILAARVSSGDPTLGIGFELNAIAAVVLGGTSLAGGRGGMPGTLLGALVIGVLDNGLSLLGVQEFDKQLLSGGMLLFAVLLDRGRGAASP